MDLSYAPAEERFRAELRPGSTANPPGPEPERLDEWVAYGKAWQRRLYEAGWCGVHWPKAYGGRGAALIEQIIFQEEMARARTPLLINLAGLTMGGPVLIAHGTEAQKQRHLQAHPRRPRRSGARASRSPMPARTSPRCETRAVLDGDAFVVNGQKVWTSFARYADWCMLLVRTDPEAPKHKGITFLLVDMHSPGITVRPLKQISGDEDFNEVFFEDVRVPRGNVDRRDQRAAGRSRSPRSCTSAQTLTFSRQLQSRVALARPARPGAPSSGGATGRRTAAAAAAEARRRVHRQRGDEVHGAAQPDATCCAAASPARRDRSRSSSGARCTSACWRPRSSSPGRTAS